VPSFCRHNRFIERCPICSKTLPENQPGAGSRARGSAGAGAKRRAAGSARTGSGGASARSASRSAGQRSRAETEQLRVRREARAQDDGYRNALLPGLHASSDAARLADELAFAGGRLAGLRTAPPDLYGEIRAVARAGELERACWMCFLTAYLSPLQGDDPFAGVRMALERGEQPSLEGIPLGPRTSHAPERGEETLRAYRHWGAQRVAGAQDGTPADAFLGEPSWTPQRRFERIFERLALPGFARMGRYDLLVTIGQLGLYELEADSLHLSAGRGGEPEDLTTVAAKRIFGIGEPIYLERRTRALADALTLELAALDLAFANWSAPARATLGFDSGVLDVEVREHARDTLGL
jgi:hypothetical protein